MTTLFVAFIATMALLVSSVRATPDALTALASSTSMMSQSSGDHRQHVEQKIAQVDPSLAPTIDISKVRASSHRDGNGDGDGTAVTATTRTTIAAWSSSRDEDEAPIERVVSIDRPTRERARLMVFLN